MRRAAVIVAITATGSSGRRSQPAMCSLSASHIIEISPGSATTIVAAEPACSINSSAWVIFLCEPSAAKRSASTK